jgi:hypothetical protein
MSSPRKCVLSLHGSLPCMHGLSSRLPAPWLRNCQAEALGHRLCHCCTGATFGQGLPVLCSWLGTTIVFPTAATRAPSAALLAGGQVMCIAMGQKRGQPGWAASLVMLTPPPATPARHPRAPPPRATAAWVAPQQHLLSTSPACGATSSTCSAAQDCTALHYQAACDDRASCSPG